MINSISSYIIDVESFIKAAKTKKYLENTKMWNSKISLYLSFIKKMESNLLNLSKDIFEIEKLKSNKLNIILFHKPRGCITSKKDEKDRKIVYDFLPKKYHQYHYIGRLDYNSEGLLLFTKETSFKRYMELPKSNIKRVYVVNVIGSFNDLKLKALNQKIYAAKIYKNPHVSLTHTNRNKHTLRFELTEGKNREIRNICEIFNLKVERLKRISFGQYKVKSIPLSKYKEMTIHESY